MVVIDAEAEFDWSKKSRAAVGVNSIRYQRDISHLFDRFSIRPSYMVDYPVSTRPEAYTIVRDLLNEGRCEIGAHLQPWDTPPSVEIANEYNSYAGNLPPALEREKLLRLTDAIKQNIGAHPRVYRAGRYGVGHATSRILVELGYEIDVSVKPETDLRAWLGPNFSACHVDPYWCGPESKLLELPLTIGFTGLAAPYGSSLNNLLNQGMTFHLPGILARLHILDRITLTPEGVTFQEMRRLTKAMVRRGKRIFCLNYHSSSLAIGYTPYVQTESGLRAFLGRLERYFDFFINEIGGQPSTPIELKALAMALPAVPLLNKVSA